MKKKILVLLAILALVAGISYAQVALLAEKDSAQQERFTVVTSFYPLYIAALNVTEGAEQTELVNLTENRGGCLHDYQLTTKDMKKLESADLLIVNGGGMEPFMEEIRSAYPKLPVLEAGYGLPLLEEAGSGEENSHIWMDPRLYKKEILNIGKGLAAADRANEERYRANAAAYGEKISGLQSAMQEELKPPVGEKVIIFHEAFSYLAQFLGMEVVDGLEPSDESGLSAGDLAGILSEIEEEGVTLLLTEEAGKEKIENAIGTKARVYSLDPLVSGVMEPDAYIKGMERNVKMLKEAMGI